jgi:hypothetical protein
MKTVSRNTWVGGKVVDNLKLHHQMYERRIQLLKECEGLIDNDVPDNRNEPTHFEVEETRRKKDE